MKISHKWLKDFIETTQDISTISEALTSVGLEVEATETIESVKGGLEGLVIGLVKERSQHPNADRLSITKVDVGGPELLQIVCGAPNVAAGQKVVVAVVGTTVHPLEGEPFKINKSKIRSEVSEGMICAEDEIGLGRSHDGIIILPEDAPIGMFAKEYYKLESDVIFEIGLTPNRADAASHLGVARDLSAIFNQPIHIPDHRKLPVHTEGEFSIQINEDETCVRYSGILLKNVKVAASPEWLKQKLASIGVKSINNVVDVTNLVCHGFGQPMHAFDADKISGQKVIVRKAKAGEVLTTLDHIERKLEGTELVIADEDKVIALAGVMGGLNTSVSEQTINIFLESACFNSVDVRKTSKIHTLKTDASFRFERGTDADMCAMALSYAVDIITHLTGAVSEAGITDLYREPVKPAEVLLEYAYAHKLIGKKIPPHEIKAILLNLGMKSIEETEVSIKVRVPLSKVDVTRPCDLVEEVLRIYGLNNIEMPTQLRSSLSFSNKPDEDRVKDLISEFLSSNGFQEIMSNSLTSAQNNSIVEETDAVEIVNPLSNELQMLRNQMLSSGMETVSYNINRKNPDLKLYEWGNTYHKKEGSYTENQHLSLFLTGKKHKEHWAEKAIESGLFTAKSFADRLMSRLGISNFKVVGLSDSAGDGFVYNVGKTPILKVSEISKKVRKQFGVDQNVYFVDVYWDDIMHLLNKNNKQYKEPSKYPEVRRDLSMLINKDVTFEQLRKLALQSEQRLLKKVDVFDVYEGDKLPEGKKSYAMSFILMDEEKTLQDQVIDGVMNKLINTFEKEAGADIRKA